MKFKYLDKVMIKDGFYDKAEGVVFGYDNITGLIAENHDRNVVQYAVNLTSSNQTIWFHEDKLELFR